MTDSPPLETRVLFSRSPAAADPESAWQAAGAVERGAAVRVARVLERLRNGPAEDERLSRLTEQERKILDLIAEGLTNRQIGERMFLAEKTVKNYVSNLLAKLGMERRTEAAVFAARLAPTDRPEGPPGS